MNEWKPLSVSLFSGRLLVFNGEEVEGWRPRAAVNTITGRAVGPVGPDLCWGVIREPVIPNPPPTPEGRQKVKENSHIERVSHSSLLGLSVLVCAGRAPD